MVKEGKRQISSLPFKFTNLVQTIQGPFKEGAGHRSQVKKPCSTCCSNFVNAEGAW